MILVFILVGESRSPATHPVESPVAKQEGLASLLHFEGFSHRPGSKKLNAMMFQKGDQLFDSRYMLSKVTIRKLGPLGYVAFFI